MLATHEREFEPMLSALTYIKSDWYRVFKLWTTEASLRYVSSAMSLALSNLAGLTWSTSVASVVRCYKESQDWLRGVRQWRSHGIIVTLYKQFSLFWLFNNPSFDKRLVSIFQPHISLSREVILAFNKVGLLQASFHCFGFNELRFKGSGHWRVAPCGA